MLDLHVMTSGGSATLAAVNTVPANDGATAAGVPIAPGAVLVGWGVLHTIADTIYEAKMTSQDQVDPINGEYYSIGTAGVEGLAHFDTNLPYISGGRLIQDRANTGAANTLAYLIDKYDSPSPGSVGSLARKITYSQVFAGALTAITWGSVAVQPTQNFPAGSYGILGAYVRTLTNYALLRFSHADFGGKKPGFPVIDTSKAAARATVSGTGCPILNAPGFQFASMGEVPTFRTTSTGTGLIAEMIDITADTPVVVVNLVKLD